VKVGKLGGSGKKRSPEPEEAGSNPPEASDSPPNAPPPVDVPAPPEAPDTGALPPAAPAAPAEAAPPAEEPPPLTDIQRRALLAETDLTGPAPSDPEEYLQKIAQEIEGLEGSEGLAELEKTRDQINNEAEERKIARDRLNGRTKLLAEKRDQLNGEVASRVAQAAEHREKRNKLNEEVKAAKLMRDQLNQKANELGDIATKLKRERHRDVAVPVPRLREDMRALEFRLQTSVLTPAKEKELTAELKRLAHEVRQAEATMESDKEVFEAVGAARKAKQDAEDQHKRLSELARGAQAEHDAMMKLYEEADALRRDADAAQGEFVANKREADEEHFRHIDLIRRVKDYEKVISGIRRRRREVRRAEGDRRQEKKTDSMMERFKKGEKLSTEDLLALQLRGE
jgi:uncharacterized coiled-coil DUF342 family protein